MARFKNLTWRELVAERDGSFKIFYSYAGILHRVLRSIRYGANPAVVLISNLIIRANTLRLDHNAYSGFNLTGDKKPIGPRVPGSLTSNAVVTPAPIAADPGMVTAANDKQTGRRHAVSTAPISEIGIY